MNRSREALVQRPLVAWVQGAKLAGKVNVSELLINIVRMIVPKLLGTDQNGTRSVIPLDLRNASSLAPPVKRQNLRQSCGKPGTW